MSLRNWLLIIFLGTIWGGAFLFNAVLIRELGPIWVSASRVGVGALGCLAYFVATRRTLPRDPRLYGAFLVMGVFSYAVPFALFPAAQAHLASGVAAILNALTPITTALVAQFWVGGEKLTWNKSVGVGAGFVGAVVLALPALSHGGSSELWAIGACVLATMCYAVTLNYSRRFGKIDPTTTATFTLAGAAIVAIPAAILFEGAPVIAHPETWLAMLGMGLVPTCFAFIVMFWLLPIVGTMNMTTTTFIAPVSAILLGFFLLGETVRTEHVLGMAGIFIGLLLIDGRVVTRLTSGRTERPMAPGWDKGGPVEQSPDAVFREIK